MTPLPVPGVRGPKAVQLSMYNAIAQFEDGSAMGWGNTDWAAWAWARRPAT